MTIRWLSVLALLGCNSSIDDPGDDPPHAYADLYTDGTNVQVVGCPSTAIIGCSPYAPGPSDHMRLFVDGRTVDVPVVATAATGDIDRVMAGVFHDGPFGVTVPVPTDPRLLVGLDDTGSDITLPRPPLLAAPAHVSRAQGTLTLAHAVLPNPSQVLFAVTTTCTDGGGGMDADVEATAGELVIDLTRHAALTGPCTYDIHVDQVVDVATAPDLPTRAIAISKATLTSEP